MNLGYIARVSKNFGVSRLHLVNPRADPKGRKALMFAKHAKDLLESAVVYKSLDAAISDCTYVIGTTGVWEKAQDGFGQALLADEAVKKVKRLKPGRVALVIGRDDTGLSSDEVSKCDIMAFIPASARYPVLNISHALAIFLYELEKNGISTAYKPSEEGMAQAGEMQRLFSVFRKMISRKPVRDRRAVERVFRKLVRSSKLNAREIHALITAIK